MVSCRDLIIFQHWNATELEFVLNLYYNFGIKRIVFDGYSIVVCFTCTTAFLFVFFQYWMISIRWNRRYRSSIWYRSERYRLITTSNRNHPIKCDYQQIGIHLFHQKPPFYCVCLNGKLLLWWLFSNIEMHTDFLQAKYCTRLRLVQYFLGSGDIVCYQPQTIQYHIITWIKHWFLRGAISELVVYYFGVFMQYWMISDISSMKQTISPKYLI